MTMSRFCLLATSMKVAYPTSDTPPPPHHHHCYTYTMMKYTTYTMMTVCVCVEGGGVCRRERERKILISMYLFVLVEHSKLAQKGGFAKRKEAGGVAASG